MTRKNTCSFFLIYLLLLSSALLSCKDSGNESYIRARIDSADKTTNLLTIEKIPQSNELGLFSGIFPDGSVIGFRLYTQPAYDTGSYHFRQADVPPVVLTSFSLQIIDFRPALKWSTAQETNLQTFILERSTDGLSWQSIGSLPGTNTATPQNYSLPDNAATALINYYYRLKMVDVDGSFRYSSVIFYNGAGDYIAYFTVGTDKLKGYNGNLQITAHDRTRKMVDGSFSFDVRTNTGQVKQVRNGSFRVFY
jgi:hypothetical protein